ncbi:MAG TPA: Xaa-Pro peptidase family protein [Syntrophorhabdales bacterium]|nr:Xaa-Pro peptidase family protein [Syntrophorhabdales bacterium]
MPFSNAERERRNMIMQRIIQAKALNALILFGEVNVGNELYGDLRYYVDNKNVANRQVAILFPAMQPVLFVGSPIQQQAASRRSSIRDCRSSNNMLADIVTLLKERHAVAGKIGVHFDVLPVKWYEYLKKELPGIDWVETHPEIAEARFHHSREEADLFRQCAQLADGGYQAALRTIRPGANEFQVAAAIEEYARARGAEQHFTLIGSGRFAPGDDNGLSLPYSPSPRRIEAGDSVVMEITPCLEGYWTQIVRTVNVGAPNPELEELYRVARDAIKKSLEVFKPGKTVRDVALAIIGYIESCGFLPKPPYGHTCGVDLNEARVSPQNYQTLERGTAVIIHPTVFTPDGKNSFFWGETYLVTDDGHERLNHASDELLTV